jgi:D-alanyl-D-alanine carboxypeptidase
VFLCFVTLGIQTVSLEASTKKEVYFVSDLTSGKNLKETNARSSFVQGSAAKLMTVYIALQYVREGHMSLETEFLVSEKAWRMGGAKSFLEVGKKYTVSDLLHGAIIQSGNDAAVAIAEGIRGSEEAFVEEMNWWARNIGMHDTNYTDATGFGSNVMQTTTATDLGILARNLILDLDAQKHRDFMKIFGKKYFTINGIKQGNRNPLVYRADGGDGLFAFFSKQNGYGLIGTARRDESRVLLIISGHEDLKALTKAAYRTVQDGFIKIRSIKAKNAEAIRIAEEKAKADKAKADRIAEQEKADQAMREKIAAAAEAKHQKALKLDKCLLAVFDKHPSADEKASEYFCRVVSEVREAPFIVNCLMVKGIGKSKRLVDAAVNVCMDKAVDPSAIDQLLFGNEIKKYLELFD